MADPHEVVAGWWRYHQWSVGSREERLAADDWYWAWEAVASMVTSRPIDAIEILVQLAEAAQSTADLEFLGASPIESLIYEHRAILGSPEGRSIVQGLDQAARSSPKFKQALGSVWYDPGEIPDHVRDQVHGFPSPRDEHS